MTDNSDLWRREQGGDWLHWRSRISEREREQIHNIEKRIAERRDNANLHDVLWSIIWPERSAWALSDQDDEIRRAWEESHHGFDGPDQWWETGGGMEWAERFLEFSDTPEYELFLERMENSPALGLSGHTLTGTKWAIQRYLKDADTPEEREVALRRLGREQPTAVAIWAHWLQSGSLAGGLLWDDESRDAESRDAESRTTGPSNGSISPAATPPCSRNDDGVAEPHHPRLGRRAVAVQAGLRAKNA